MSDLFDLDEGPVPLSAQIAAVEREIDFRKRLYPRWTEIGRMTVAQAERELRTMRAVLATLKSLEEHHESH